MQDNNVVMIQLTMKLMYNIVRPKIDLQAGCIMSASSLDRSPSLQTYSARLYGVVAMVNATHLTYTPTNPPIALTLSIVFSIHESRV